jgi:DNA-binding beta-propeller fold protein YncE
MHSSHRRTFERAILAALSISGLPTLAATPSASTPDHLAPSSTFHYHITKAVPLGAPDSWDYVIPDPDAHRIFVAHGNRVTVVDEQTATVIGQVEGFTGVTHGIALAHEAAIGYTDDDKAGKAASFDLKTLRPIKRTKTGDDADALTFDPVSGHIFVINGEPGTVTIIDPKRDTAIATVKVSPGLEYAVPGGDGKLFINASDQKQIARLDTSTNRVDARWPIANCDAPHGLAIDITHRRLFSSCVNSLLVVVNIDTGAEVATVPIGKGSDAVVFDPRRNLILSSNGRDGTLSVIQEKDPNTFTLVDTVKTVVTARTMGIDPGTGRIYLAAADPQPNPPSPKKAPARTPIIPGSLKLLFLDP